MKILVISNFYPPHYIGGYELGCQDVVEGLKARGHEVKVLTSTYGLEKPTSDGEIFRWLEARILWKDHRWIQRAKLIRMELNNQNALERLYRIYDPDVVYVWNLGSVSVSLVLRAQDWGLQPCYFVSDGWLSQWECDPWYSVWFGNSATRKLSVARIVLRPFLSPLGIIPKGSLDPRHVQFASHYLKHVALQVGKAVHNAEVIHWGIDSNRFRYKEIFNNPKRLLYVGQIVPHKGVHVAISALNAVIRQYGFRSARLTLVGGSQQPDYLLELQRLVRSYGLDEQVHFTGLVPRERLPQIYHDHDILLFPSSWEEPFSITLLEGMACGLAVVSTATGGSSEVLEDEVNALVFPREDAVACASQVRRLFNDPLLFERIRQKGRHTVEDKFRFGSMLDLIERSLVAAAQTRA